MDEIASFRCGHSRPCARSRRGDGERRPAAGTGQQADRMASGRRTVRLAGHRRGGERTVPERSPRLDGRRSVSELERPSPEVRRDARRRQLAGRDRDGQHGDDEVHGGGRIRGPARQVDVRELRAVAARPREVGHVRRQDLRRAVLRRLARRDLPDRPLHEGGDQEAADEPRAAHRRREEAGGEERRAKGFSPVYFGGDDWYVAMGFVYDYGGTIATHACRQVGRRARLAAGDPGPDGVQELLPRDLDCEQDERQHEAEPVRRLRPGQGWRRSSARAGTAAASARSSSRRRRSSSCRATPRASRSPASSAAPISPCR